MDWMMIARQMSVNSQDPSTKVGAVIHDDTGRALGFGWNQFPKGVPKEWWMDRARKYLAVVHAEVDAIITTKAHLHGATMTVTAHPCVDCAKVIVAAGIRCIVCPPGPWRDDPAVIETVRNARELFDVCGVKVIDAV